jgi:hypothetical protein
MTEEILPSSFRDPSGFVFHADGVLYRQVNRDYQQNFELLNSSGLYKALVDEGLMIPHEDLGAKKVTTSDGITVLKPEPVPFISYPYEWSFSQLKDAALTTLQIQKRALEHGMSLRDSSAFNIQFHEGKPILIDTLSFEARPEGKPWVAYRQFCQHFLAPLALMSHVDIRLGQLSRLFIDGVPLDLASSLLPRSTRYRPALGLHVHAHAKSQKKHLGEAIPQEGPKRAFSDRAMQGVMESLTSAIRKQTFSHKGSTWSDYYSDAGSYTDSSLDHKRELVDQFLAESSPSVVWDLGANTGMYSRIASARGARTISFEFDPVCVEENYLQVVRDKETKVLPLVLDLTNPSGGVGWDNTERSSLTERGPADVVMALALVHHLAIGNNVPLPLVASYFRKLCGSLIVEFVPKSDPKTQLLLSSREDIFPNYTREGFEAAFKTEFKIERAEDIKGSERVLYLMR